MTDRRPLALAAAVCLAGCGRSGPRDAALELVVPTPPQSIDPRFSTDATGLRISRLAHAGLVRLDPDTLLPAPHLARAVSLTGLEVRVELREGLRFASGAPLEADDVCATLDAIADPRLASPHRQVLAAYAGCVVEGPLAARITLREARGSWMSDLELPVLRRDQAGSTAAPGSALDGLGPFRVVSSDPQAVRLEPSQGGVGPAPRHAIVIRTIRDENARALRMLSGGTDVVPNALSPTSLRALSREGVTVVRRPGANLTYLALNNEKGPTARPEVRRALAQAIDKATLARTVLEGNADVATTFLPPGSFAHRPAREPVAHAPEAARRVLAGVSLNLLVSSDRTRGLLARAIAQDLTDVGAKVEVVPIELGVMLSRLSAGDFELSLLQIPEITEPHVLSWFFRSTSIPGEGQGANRARYRSKELDALLDEAGRATDLEVRRHVYDHALSVLERDLPVVPLFHEMQVAAVSPRARGFVPSGEGRWGALAGIE